MDVERFKDVGLDLFGNAWQTRLARALGVDGSTVRRWVANGVPVPTYIEAYLNVLGDRQEARGGLLLMRLATNPLTFVAGAETPIDFMQKKLAFPGVEQTKPMPAIHAAFDGQGRRLVRIDGAPKDAIIDEAESFVMTRHPDKRHLKGYVDAAAARGLRCIVASHKFHHYSLIVQDGQGEPTLTHVIATHAGDIRMIVADIGDPEKVIKEIYEPAVAVS